MTRKPPDLATAYNLKTPDDNRALYADWAQTYDDGFASKMDYRLPMEVARIFARQEASGPVLDVGAGTGLLVEHLPDRERHVIDALDISAQMLEIAMAKGIYRRAIEADLTQPLALEDASYGAVVSSGTFTHGHLGPDALDPLLRIGKPGAVFVIAINAEHFDAMGFAAKFADLEPVIEMLAREEVPIYGSNAADAHKDDRATIVVFRKR